MDRHDDTDLKLEDILYMVFCAGYDAGRDEEADLVTAFDAYLERISNNDQSMNDSYDPVEEAYKSLVNDDDVEAAIGYLGEALGR